MCPREDGKGFAEHSDTVSYTAQEDSNAPPTYGPGSTPQAMAPGRYDKAPGKPLASQGPPNKTTLTTLAGKGSSNVSSCGGS